MIQMILIPEVERIGSPILGIIIPGVVLVISFVLTWMLYRRFSKK